ncbi:MAG: bifunctional diguanylate cyclase/phosphodiesterase [Actinobacteria bacterium]|nr:bifunctional diguanylate cyclase/phosphodiesterase [Actinomycetota bacterium]
MLKAIWRRYLFVGLVVSALGVALPLGVGRNLIFGLIGASSAAAILVGVRRNRPARPTAWYLFAAGTAIWTLSDGLSGWSEQMAMGVGLPSLADVLHLAMYPLFAAGLLLLGRRRGVEQGVSGLDETAIITVALALVTWVFLIEPTWAAYDEPLVNRLVGVAYPLGDVLIFALLVRLATSAGEQNTAFLLAAGSVCAMLVAHHGEFATGAFEPPMAHPNLLNFVWLLSYVLWGAAALHPSMRELAWPPPPRALKFSTVRLATLGMAVASGPVILGGELIAGHQLDVGPVVVASGFGMVLARDRIQRMLRLLEYQTERLGTLADTDYVTGLATSRRFADRLGEFLGDTHGKVAGFLLIDVERFAEIHDTLGHQTGDAILHAIGVRLKEQTVGRALVARMGGNTFGVLDPSITSGEEALHAAAGIREALELPLDLPDLSVSVEVSVGALLLPEDGADPTQALLRADVALLVARARSGRTANFDILMESGNTLAPLLIGKLREAIGSGDIVVHYQPQVELRTGRAFGVEALVRWQHPNHGLLGPDVFVHAAEQTGLIGPLMQHVLDSALGQCALWRSEGLDLTVSVNLSVRNLLDPKLVDNVRSALQRHGLPAPCLELEITESSAMMDPRHSIQVLGALAALGVKLSIDDYGTGQSSLAYLQKLPVGRLKIDQSFVTGMNFDDASAAIVQSTIELARVLRLDVVAEGVEDDATLLRLRDMKCYAAQGFGLGRPVAAPLLPELIRSIEERLPEVLGTSILSRALRGA